MLARQNLVAAVGALFLSAGATAAWAATDELAEEEGSELLERAAKRSDRPTERNKREGEPSKERSEPRASESRSSASESTDSQGSASESTESRDSASESTESRDTESRSSLRAALREDRLPEERQTQPQPESAAADGDTTETGVIAGVPTATLEAIASCESGGDPTAVSADGTYRGKYQFDTGTWASVGGSGDPAAAPEAEQDYRASLLYQQAGTSPWPNCG